jgi:hypothetical protein
MCFWFGPEILRLVYKKAFFEILNFSILFDLLSSEKIASFDTLFAQFLRNFFQLLYGTVLLFLEVKRSNKIETVQYFKKTLF